MISTSSKAKLNVEAKVKIENYFMFGYNYRSTSYKNKKLLNYLDVIK